MTTASSSVLRGPLLCFPDNSNESQGKYSGMGRPAPRLICRCGMIGAPSAPGFTLLADALRFEGSRLRHSVLRWWSQFLARGLVPGRHSLKDSEQVKGAGPEGSGSDVLRWEV